MYTIETAALQGVRKRDITDFSTLSEVGRAAESELEAQTARRSTDPSFRPKRPTALHAGPYAFKRKT